MCIHSIVENQCAESVNTIFSFCQINIKNLFFSNIKKAKIVFKKPKNTNLASKNDKTGNVTLKCTKQRWPSVLYRTRSLESNPAGYREFFGFGLDIVSSSAGLSK